MAGCEQASSIFSAYISPTNTCAAPGMMEDRQNSNQVEGEGHLNRRRHIHSVEGPSHMKKCSTISRSSHYSVVAARLKVAERDSSCLAPGTGVYYMPRRSINSKGYGKVCIVEALSLLADVSCKLKRMQQLPSNLSPKIPQNDADYGPALLEHLNQIRSSRLTSAQSNFTESYCKEEPYDDQHSRRQPLLRKENSYKVVRKLRTPRRTSVTLLRCITKLQKNVSLCKCDEVFSCVEASSSWIDTGRLRNRQPMPDTSAPTSTNKVMLFEEGKFSNDKSMCTEVPHAAQSETNLERFSNDKSMSTDLAPQAAQSEANLERFSKSSCQFSGIRKKFFRGFKRAERISNGILHFIGEMSVPEKLIRQALGNTPDTSKALRLLLAERKVTRLGDGGRGQAYKYVATEKGLHQLRGVEQALSEVVALTPESECASSCNPIGGTRIV